MLQFKEVALSDRAVLEPILRRQPYRICDHAFSCLYIWDKTYPARWCLEDGILYIVYLFPDGSAYYQMPIGAGDRLPGAIDRLREDAAARGVPLELVTVNEEMKAELEAALPGAFAYTQVPEAADYLYDAEALRELSGKRLHAKRNYINRFVSENEGSFAFEDIGPENAREVLEFNALWDREHGLNLDFIHEAEAVERALLHLREAGMFGVALRLDGHIIAYALGTQLGGDTVLEQIEKALPLPGAYQMINREFALRFSQGFAYINREEDLGIEGLRRAKQSYYPAFLNMRWRAMYHG